MGNNNNIDKFDNKVTILIKSKSINENFARATVSAFFTQLDPTISELTDIKTAVSEAVTNAIIHGYETTENSEDKEDIITIRCGYKERFVHIEIEDTGSGIYDIEKAKEPLHTSKPDMERSGMGFTVMETFMDSVEIISEVGKGTKVIMTKLL